MFKQLFSAALLALTLAGCSSNYKYSDVDYRPQGDPSSPIAG